MGASVLHLIKTKSFQSDGRLLKWVNSLTSEGISSEVFILEDSNERRSFTQEKTLVRSTSLLSRRIFGKRKGYLFKIPEYSIGSLKKVIQSSSDVVIFHDVQHYLTLLILCTFRFLHRKKLVWDLHELPHPVICRTTMTRKIVRFILEKVDLVIYTNAQRRYYLKNQIGHAERNFAILNNYPGEEYLKKSHSELPEDLRRWLDGKPYMLWMGIASPGRNFNAVIEAYRQYKDEFKLVVMGSIAPEYAMDIEAHFGRDRVFSKFVTQSEIPQYVDNALFSIVLYKNTTPNNWLCEPNRLYQLVCRGVPVICGSNPPLKEVVKPLGVGVVLEDDGSNSENMRAAIKECLINLDNYKRKYDLLDRANLFSWEKQFGNVSGKLKELV